MAVLIPDDGSRSARLVLIGEAGGAHEEAQKRPFCGPAGMKLRDWWADVGLQRSDFYITNCYPYRPPKNVIEAVPREEVLAWVEQLHDRLAALDDPWLIVPTGNTALKALTGRGRWPWEVRNAAPGITAHRGSIYEYEDRKGRKIKVIPTIHPAAVFRQSTWEGRCIADWRRISDDAGFRDLRTPEREHYIKPTLDDIRHFVEVSRTSANALSIDIETPRERTLQRSVDKRGKERFKYVLGAARITCVGFSSDPLFSITIPTTRAYWGDQEFVDDAWALIRELCALPCYHAGQNFLFDRWWLAQPEYACPVTNAVYDTRWMDHCCNPNDDHDLGYQASLHTREPYWKDDGKGSDDMEGDPGDIETYWRYNGKDAAVTRELVDVHSERLDTLGKRATYNKLYAPMYDVFLATMLRGVRVDARAQKRRYMALTAECIGIQDQLTAIAGERLYGKKDLSRVALQRFLHETLGLPKVRDRKTQAVTVKEVAIRRLMLRYPDKLGRDDEPERAGALILRHRRKFKLGTFIKEGVVDADGRSRCTYGFVDTLRTNSGKNPKRTGNNHQNQDRELLDLFVPDAGHVFVEVDLSQIQDRIVKMLTRSPRLIARAQSAPWENDEHTRGAAIIFYHDPEAYHAPFYVTHPQVTKMQRYLGKRCRHAGNFDLHGLKLSEELLKEGYTLTPEECQGYITAIIDNDTPEVREWQREMRHIVLRDRAVACPSGFVVEYAHERFNDDLYRRAYALIPQNEEAYIMCQFGWIPLYHWLRANKMQSFVAKMKHDSLVVSCPREEAWCVAVFLHTSLTSKKRVIGGQWMPVWAELKVGRTEAGTHEWKRFPTRDEFEDVCRSIVAVA